MNSVEAFEFSKQFSAFLEGQESIFSHQPTGDHFGFSIRFAHQPKNITLFWKVMRGYVDLTFYKEHIGQLKTISIPSGMERRLKGQDGLKSDMLIIPVGPATWSKSFSEQIDIANEVVDACKRLRPIAFDIAAMS